MKFGASPRPLRRVLIATAFALTLGTWGAEAADAEIDLAELSLAQLMDVRVSSVSLRLQERDSVTAEVKRQT